MKDEGKEIEQKLIKEFVNWEHCYTFGFHDPFWEDGVNLNLIRNHISYYKNQLKELGYFPEIYYRENPPEVDSRYMARPDEIREHARRSLVQYEKDENFQYLMKNKGRLNKRESEEIHLSNVIGYAYSLASSIKEDSLVKMRLYGKIDSYLDAFKTCRERMEKILAEQNQEKQIVFTEEQTGQLRFA